MKDILSGMLLAGYCTVALFFLRFWTQSRDRLFALFATAFAILAVQRVALMATHASLEDQTVFYVLRLTAFIVILVAIVDKNRR